MNHSRIFVILFSICCFFESGILIQGQTVDIGTINVVEWNSQGTQYAISSNPNRRSCTAQISSDFDVLIIDGLSNISMQRLSGNRCQIYSLDWNYDGTQIAGVNAEDIVTVWDVRTGEIMSTYGGLSIGANISSVNWHPTQNLLLYTWTYGGYQAGFSFIEGNISISVGEPSTGRTTFTDARWYGATGNLIVGEQDGDIVIWDVESNSEVSTIATHPSPPYSIELSPNNQFVASTNHQDGIVSVIDISEQEMLFQFTVDWAGDIAWHSESTYLAVSASNYLQVYEVATGRLVEEFQYSERIYSVSWYPNSYRLLIGGHNSLLTEVVIVD